MRESPSLPPFMWAGTRVLDISRTEPEQKGSESTPSNTIYPPLRPFFDHTLPSTTLNDGQRKDRERQRDRETETERERHVEE
tara:strand:- start:243 stop:488 length:246 start_codon:yes stop_codon:yes gene_type:complete